MEGLLHMTYNDKQAMKTDSRHSQQINGHHIVGGAATGSDLFGIIPSSMGMGTSAATF